MSSTTYSWYKMVSSEYMVYIFLVIHRIWMFSLFIQWVLSRILQPFLYFMFKFFCLFYDLVFVYFFHKYFCLPGVSFSCWDVCISTIIIPLSEKNIWILWLLDISFRAFIYLQESVVSLFFSNVVFFWNPSYVGSFFIMKSIISFFGNTVANFKWKLSFQLCI